MQNPLQRERSLKKLHFCIANYHPSTEDKSALVTAQQDLRDKIEFKFKKSNINQTYVFPRKQVVKEEYLDAPQTVNLHNQVETAAEIEQRQKPKIKLAKGRAEKRLQTEHFDRGGFEENFPHPKLEERKSNYNSRPLCENAQNISPMIMTQPLKERVKTEYSREQTVKKESSSRKLQTPLFLNTLQRDSANSRGKSKLNMLTKSYMNLKSGKQQLEYSLESQTAISIRTNDYKFMPNSTNHRNYASNSNSATVAGFNSTRQLKSILYGAGGCTDMAMAKEVADPKSLQKIQSLLPNKKYFKAK